MPTANAAAADDSFDRSPVDLAITPDGRWLITANETSNSVSLVNVASGQLVDEIACGSHPADVEITPDGKLFLVSGSWSGDVTVLSLADDRLQKQWPRLMSDFSRVESPSPRTARQPLSAWSPRAKLPKSISRQGNFVAASRWENGRGFCRSPQTANAWRSVAAAAATSLSSTRTPVELLYEEPLANGVNLGQMVTSADGLYAYFTWMVYRTNPITIGNIRRGWVLASRIGRVRLDGPADREAISLDVPGMAVSDPHGIVISGDGNRLVAQRRARTSCWSIASRFAVCRHRRSG